MRCLDTASIGPAVYLGNYVLLRIRAALVACVEDPLFLKMYLPVTGPRTGTYLMLVCT